MFSQLNKHLILRRLEICLQNLHKLLSYTLQSSLHSYPFPLLSISQPGTSTVSFLINYLWWKQMGFEIFLRFVVLFPPRVIYNIFNAPFKGISWQRRVSFQGNEPVLFMVYHVKILWKVYYQNNHFKKAYFRDNLSHVLRWDIWYGRLRNISRAVYICSF